LAGQAVLKQPGANEVTMTLDAAVQRLAREAAGRGRLRGRLANTANVARMGAALV